MLRFEDLTPSDLRTLQRSMPFIGSGLAETVKERTRVSRGEAPWTTILKILHMVSIRHDGGNYFANLPPRKRGILFRDA